MQTRSNGSQGHAGSGRNTRRLVRQVVLLNPPMRPETVFGEFSEWAGVSPPSGLCYVAAAARQAGYEVSILDAEALGLNIDQTVEKVLQAAPDVVGMACKTLWVVNAHQVAERLKERQPDLPIIAGGNHATALPERTLREFPSFDIAVIGEGEITFVELLRAVGAGSPLGQVRGLAFRQNGHVVVTPPRPRVRNLDELPYPAFDLLPNLASHYRPPLTSVERLPAFSIMNSRGCPCQCTFCDRSVFGNCVTKHSPEYTAAMVEDLRRNHGIRYLMFDDDNLLLSKRHLFRLLDLMDERGVRLPFTCQSRIDTVDQEKLRRLKEAGCRMIQFGVESGSQEILNRMKKGITVEQIHQTVGLANRIGIKTAGFFILGYPGETRETMEQTVRLIRRCKFFDVGIFLFTPLPGSEAYRDAADYGEYQEDWARANALDQVVFVPKGLTAELLTEFVDKCYRACYFRPWQVLSVHRRLTSMAHMRAVAKSLPKLIA